MRRSHCPVVVLGLAAQLLLAGCSTASSSATPATYRMRRIQIRPLGESEIARIRAQAAEASAAATAALEAAPPDAERGS